MSNALKQRAIYGLLALTILIGGCSQSQIDTSATSAPPINKDSIPLSSFITPIPEIQIEQTVLPTGVWGGNDNAGKISSHLHDSLITAMSGVALTTCIAVGPKPKNTNTVDMSQTECNQGEKIADNGIKIKDLEVNASGTIAKSNSGKLILTSIKHILLYEGTEFDSPQKCISKEEIDNDPTVRKLKEQNPNADLCFIYIVKVNSALMADYTRAKEKPVIVPPYGLLKSEFGVLPDSDFADENDKIIYANLPLSISKLYLEGESRGVVQIPKIFSPNETISISDMIIIFVHDYFQHKVVAARHKTSPQGFASGGLGILHQGNTIFLQVYPDGEETYKDYYPKDKISNAFSAVDTGSSGSAVVGGYYTGDINGPYNPTLSHTFLLAVMEYSMGNSQHSKKAVDPGSTGLAILANKNTEKLFLTYLP